MAKKTSRYILILLLVFSAYRYYSANTQFRLEQKATPDILLVESCQRYTLSKKIPVVLFSGKLSIKNGASVVSYSSDKLFRENNNLPHFYIDVNSVCDNKGSSVPVWVYEDYSTKIKGDETINPRIELMRKKAVLWRNILVGVFVTTLIFFLWID